MPEHERREVAIESKITDRPIGETGALDRLSTVADGAVLVFQGRVRDMNDGRPVSGLAYEAYGEMAEKELAAICREAAARFDIGALHAVHRVGELGLGEVAVEIGVAAPHRDACYAASRYVIEELKQRLPVWKQERYVDGASEWLGAPDSTKAGSP